MISFCDIDGRVGFKQLWDLIDWDKQKLIVSRIQARIVKAVISTNCEINCRVFSYTLSMLEPYEVKISRTVLGGLGTGNSPRLPDTANSSAVFEMLCPISLIGVLIFCRKVFFVSENEVLQSRQRSICLLPFEIVSYL